MFKWVLISLSPSWRRTGKTWAPSSVLWLFKCLNVQLTWVFSLSSSILQSFVCFCPYALLLGPILLSQATFLFEFLYFHFPFGYRKNTQNKYARWRFFGSYFLLVLVSEWFIVNGFGNACKINTLHPFTPSTKTEQYGVQNTSSTEDLTQHFCSRMWLWTFYF